jgi:hypothetical protein
MRICLGVLLGNHTMVSTNSSEPLLAEAAYSAMSRFKACEALEYYVRESTIGTGDHGQLIGAQIMLAAQDAARSRSVRLGQGLTCRAVSLSGFFEALFYEKTASRILSAMPSCVASNADFCALKDRFPHARIWFNHYIKVHSLDVLSRKYLWRYVSRGAALICANNQGGIDAVYIFVINSTKPVGRENVGVILTQWKNTRKISTNPHLPLFDVMDPFALGIYKRKEKNPPPVIRIVFALAATAPCVKLIELRKEQDVVPQAKLDANVKITVVAQAQRKSVVTPASPSTKVHRNPWPPYAAYDIWCGGASSATFACINANEDDVYNSLLKLSMRRLPAYSQRGDDNTVQSVRRSMGPGDEEDAAHWSNWISEDAGNPGALSEDELSDLADLEESDNTE